MCVCVYILLYICEYLHTYISGIYIEYKWQTNTGETKFINYIIIFEYNNFNFNYVYNGHNSHEAVGHVHFNLYELYAATWH